MGLSGYSDDCGGWEFICWRGAVASAIRGKRGQSFLREALVALDAMPDKRLIAKSLELEPPEFVPPGAPNPVCTLGSVGQRRGLDMSGVDPYEEGEVAALFGVAPALVKEIEFLNDEVAPIDPAFRWQFMRDWISKQIVDAPPKTESAP